MSCSQKIKDEEELYSYCKHEVFDVVFIKVTKEELADDITSDVFMSIMCHKKWFFGIDAERQKEYICNVTEKVCKSHIELFGRKSYEFNEDKYGEITNNKDEYHFIETDEIRKWISELPESERRTVEKRYIYNKSIEMIAVEEGVSVNAVSKRLSRARHKLKSTIMSE